MTCVGFVVAAARTSAITAWRKHISSVVVTLMKTGGAVGDAAGVGTAGGTNQALLLSQQRHRLFLLKVAVCMVDDALEWYVIHGCFG